MQLIRLETLDHPGLAPYRSLTDTGLRGAPTPLFIAESPKVIRSALDSGYGPVSLLCEEKHLSGDAAPIIARLPEEATIFTGSRELLRSLTGYTLTRGVLCAMKRAPLPTVGEVLGGATRIAVLDGVCDTTNIGSVFRSAAALGIDAILLTPGTCDPLNRRCVRVSMGSVFRLPWTWLSSPVTTLGDYGFKTVAMALREDSIPLDSPALLAEPKLAILLGTEGDGLAPEVISDADHVVRIPMSRGVDSLNVGSAAAIAFWQLCRTPRLNG